jgi:hypothetical protein
MNTRYSVYAFVVLLPVNYHPYNGPLLRGTAESNGNRPELYDDDSLMFAVYGNISDSSQIFYKLTIANIQPGDHVSMLAHMVGVILLAGTVIYHLQIELEEFLRLRVSYLSNSLRKDDEPPQKRHLKAVLVEDIPKLLRNPGNLEYYMDLLYPGQVEKVIMVNKTRELKSIIESRDAIMNHLEHTLLKLHVAVHFFHRAGQKWYYDLADKLQGELNGKNKEIVREVELIRDVINGSALKDRDATELVRTTNEIHGEIFGDRTRGGKPQVGSPGARSTSHSTFVDARMRSRSTVLNFSALLPIDDDDEDCSNDSCGDDGRAENEELLDRATEYQPTVFPPKEQFTVRTVKRDDGVEAPRGISAADQVRLAMTGPGAEAASPKLAAKNMRHVLLGAGLGSIRDREFGSKAFIVFKRYTEATLAQQVIHSKFPGLMKVTPCPDRDDWMLPPNNNNWTSTNAQLIPKKFLVGVIIIFLILLFIVPATALGFLCSDNGSSMLMKVRLIRSTTVV